jgi:hypothetical protein
MQSAADGQAVDDHCVGLTAADAHRDQPEPCVALAQAAQQASWGGLRPADGGLDGTRKHPRRGAAARRTVADMTSLAPLATETESRAYFPIASHGVIGDMRTVALVATAGPIDWYCPPAFDSPSVFGAILDREHRGYYRIAPLRECTPKQPHPPDTNVLITRFLSLRSTDY